MSTIETRVIKSKQMLMEKTAIRETVNLVAVSHKRFTPFIIRKRLSVHSARLTILWVFLFRDVISVFFLKIFVLKLQSV